ncbi:hypothetical protein EYD10_08337 [Varanus komodoensis]|nr:hypothetical protein EYD10_08337 [Varanus komodoensis]
MHRGHDEEQNNAITAATTKSTGRQNERTLVKPPICIAHVMLTLLRLDEYDAQESKKLNLVVLGWLCLGLVPWLGKGDAISLPELTEIVSDLVLRTPRMLVLGNFNLNAETGLTGVAQDFMASMTAMGLSQHVTGPTHECGHTLDLVFSTGQEEGGCGPDYVGPPPEPDGFLKALGEFPADKTSAPVEALVKLWNGEMTRAVDTIAPKHPLPPGRAHSSPWYTSELQVMKQARRWLECRWRKSWDEYDRTHLRAHYWAYAVAVRAAKKKFFSVSIASSKCRPAELFRVVQGLVCPGPKKDLVPPSKARCDDFAKHFREKIAQIRHKLDSTSDSEASGEIPMLPSGPKLMDEFQLLQPDDVDKVLGQVRPTTCLLDPCPSWLINNTKHGIGTWILEVVNTSLREGWVPAPLKEAVVRPILKKTSLDPEMATNYRPVANILFLGKALEWVVAGQLQALLDETDYLDPFQSGFRPGYGTESALVALYDDLCREKDRGSASLLVLLGLSVAFDTINHGILLDRLAGLGVGGTALQWFRSYLNGRFQKKVVLGDYGSAPWQKCHGVPQGSILSPLLFNVYMKPLGEVIRRCGLRNHQYADDTLLYLSFSTNPGEAVAVLNQCLAEVMGWMRANKLKLNPDKTEILLAGGSGFREGELNLVLNRVALPLRDKVRSMGVLLDPELSLEAQLTAVARSAFFQLRLIHQLCPYLENDCLVTVTHMLVTSRLDFCNTLYVGLPLKTIQMLQLVQSRAARLLPGTGHYVHMTPVLRQLHWLPIEVQAQFKVLVMPYKALNGLGPGYLKERLGPYMPAHPLRAAGEALLQEPSMKEIRRVLRTNNNRRPSHSCLAFEVPRDMRLATPDKEMQEQVFSVVLLKVETANIPEIRAFFAPSFQFLYLGPEGKQFFTHSFVTRVNWIVVRSNTRVSNSRPAGHLLGRARHGGGALWPSKRRRHPGRPPGATRDEWPTPTAVVEYLMRPSLTQTLLPAAPSLASHLVSPSLPISTWLEWDRRPQYTVVITTMFENPRRLTQSLCTPFYPQIYIPQRLYRKEEFSIKKVKEYIRKGDLPKLPEKYQTILNQEVTTMEITEAIMGQKNNKTPGPDGLPAEFYKSFEGVFATLLKDICNEALLNAKIPDTWTEANITFIQKEDMDLTQIQNYRPISLLNVDYKFFASILAERLKKFLIDFIHPDQNGFLPKRQMKNNLRTILDILEYYETHMEKAMALLFLDTQKAFDNVNWQFMMQQMDQMEFGGKIMNVISSIYQRQSARILINGERTRAIEIQKGTRQGCPLSPLLFILTLEVLNRNIRDDEDIKGTKIRDEKYKLQAFADDLVFIIEEPFVTIPKFLQRIEEYDLTALDQVMLKTDEKMIKRIYEFLLDRKMEGEQVKETMITWAENFGYNIELEKWQKLWERNIKVTLATSYKENLYKMFYRWYLSPN